MTASHRCPDCGQPDCSLPAPSWFGVPHWLIAFAVIVALPVAMLVYTASVR